MDNTDEKTEEQIPLDISEITMRLENPPLPEKSETTSNAADVSPNVEHTADKSQKIEKKQGAVKAGNPVTAPVKAVNKRSSPEDSANKIRSMLSRKENVKENVSTESSQKIVSGTRKLSDMEVMEHTASIWQYKNIVDNGTEMHSEYHEKQIETELGIVTAARVRGKKHKHEGTNCDDYFETAITDDCVICAVCDGAGSKPLSRIGSRVSAETAVKYLRETLGNILRNDGTLKEGLCAPLDAPEFMSSCEKLAPVIQQSAREAFAAQQIKLTELCEDEKYKNALGRKPVIGDLSTTFLAAVCIPLEVDGKRQTFLICVQIGDGCICAVDSKKSSEHCVKLMGKADSGAFSGETDFLSEKTTRPEVIASKTRISRGSSDVIMLMTDGVADDYFPAEPMMKRLYLDLCLNGILPMEGELCEGEDPAPIRFKSVSLSQTSVALQYSKQLLSGDAETAVNALWDKRGVLRCHSLEAFRMNIGDTSQQRLRVWLDNYNERGSFDDRTLVVIQLGKC